MRITEILNMNTLNILAWIPHSNCHECYWVERDKKVFVDVMVDGNFPDTKPEDLVGRTIYCERMSPYEYIANGVFI